MTKLTYGVGFNSMRKHKTKKGNKHTGAYEIWRHIMQRCYSYRFHIKNPTYIGCTVCEEWHDFQDFADWYYSQPYSDTGYQLDKDILVTNNKTYSPDTCCFLPQELNVLLTNCKPIKGGLPQGVCLSKRSGRYRATISIENKKEHLGYFDCPNEAHKAYKKAKESNVKRIAKKWKGRIEDNAFSSLMTWQLTE